MLYYIDSAGVVQAAIPDTVTQGAINVNDIVIIAPFPISTVVTAAIMLPNGMKIYPRCVGYEEIQESDYAYKFAPITAFEGKIPAPDGVTVNVWKMTLDRALAQKAGALRLTFLFTDAYGHTLPSTEVTLNVGRASPYLSPTVTANDLNTIQAYLAAAQAAVLSAEAVAASVAKTWDLVIGPDNADLLGTLSESEARSILVSGVDLYYVALPTINSFKTIQAGAGLRELEFRGCRYTSEGAAIRIIGNAVAKIHGVDFPAVYEISNFASVENCNAGIFTACEFMTGCIGNVARGCKTITGSDIATIDGCTYVDPFSVKTANTSSVNKVAVVTADGTPRFAECAKAIDVSVNQENYVLTITLKGLTDGVMSTATVDLPIEQIVVSGTVSADGDELILTLKNGETITIPVSGIVSGLVEQTSAANQIYGTDASGNQTTVPYNKSASPNNVVQRTSMGNINLPETQENDSQAVRKKYVDDAIATLGSGGKLYKHDVNLFCGEYWSGYSNIYASFVSTSETPITTIAELNASAAVSNHYLNCHYADLYLTDSAEGARQVDNVFIFANSGGVSVTYITAYTVPPTTSAMRFTADAIRITDTVTEV